LRSGGEMETVWLVRYAELFLKSDPVRRHWEQVLARSIRDRLPGVEVRVERGRLWLTGPVDPERLATVFGIASFSETVPCRLGELDRTVLDYVDGHRIDRAERFAVRVKRSGIHDFTSSGKAAALGALILEAHPGLRVDLDHPDFELHVEIRDERCYLYHQVTPGPGGLPPGVEGTLVALLSGGIDSPVAAYLMMKRGCRIVPLYVGLESYLDEGSLSRTKEVLEVLRRYDPLLELRVHNDGYLARAKGLMRPGDQRLTCVICKRRMYRLAQELATEVGALGIVTGESLGQVASQTLENLQVLDEAVSLPVYRPLIGLDKDEIVRIARRIGTFCPSTGGGAGCRAVPRMPTTKARLDDVKSIEARVDALAGRGE